MTKWWNDNFGPRQEGGLGDIGSIKRKQQAGQGLKDAVVGRNHLDKPSVSRAER